MDVMNLPNGHVLQNGKYRISHVIGQGGFGITYKGIWYTEVKGSLGTVKTEVPVCIKEYFFKDYCYRLAGSPLVKVHSETGRVLFDKFKEKLIKEAKILSEVHHPYIVNVLEVFEENETAYIAMEYISGCSLKYMLDKEGILPEKKVLRYIQQIGKALEFVHGKSILHLDIKPSNILIDSKGNARLIDFGVSKRYDIEQQETSTTMLTLSKGFASIEQYDNEGTQSFSPCPDIYSLGATMYNLLTNKIPVESILRATHPLPNPKSINPDISEKTEQVILKAMQIVPADRYQSVTEMLSTLDFPTDESFEDNHLSGEESENQSESDGDTTIDDTVLQSVEKPQKKDSEKAKIEGALEKKKKRKRKNAIISIVIAIFACVGLVIAFWMKGNKSVSTQNGITATLDKSFGTPKEPSINVDSSSVLEADNKANKAALESVNKEGDKQTLKEAEKSLPSNLVDANKSDNNTPSNLVMKDKLSQLQQTKPSETLANADALYSSLVASGKSKMNSGDYANARKDFAKAKEAKLTEEVVRLMITCDSKEADKALSDKKLQYEEKMTFGKYKIVRKKSTGKYGAIDTNVEERIPCKYLNVGIADNGRAFEREDGLFDIYNIDGALINKGVTYY